MKKLYTRIAACSLAVLIAFNTVAIPKAEAVITESALVSAFVATYSAAAGFAYRGEPFPGTEQMPAVVRYFETVIDDFVEAYEMTEAEFEALIMSGVQYVGDGVVKIGSAAAGLLSSFTEWLVDIWGLVAGGDPVTVYSEYDYMINGKPLIAPAGLSDYTAYAVPYSNTPYDISNAGGISINAASNGYVMVYWRAADADSVSSTNVGTWSSKDVHTSDLGFTALRESLGVVFYAVKADGSLGSERITWKDAGIGIDFSAVSGLVASLGSDYEAAPTVDEQYAMVIDTGMTIEDEQDFVDSVLGGMLAGTLAPTYTIEQAAGGDVVVPDEGEDTDTQAGILSSVKNIAQNVIALPQTIAEAIKGIFVPDVALTTEITDAFSAKFSFVPTLHRLGMDLLSIGPDSKPPVVYIHLEDAEGAIDYGGTVKALDMSWYQRYKEDGDRIIGGFLWLGFLWLLFKRVPAIINGGEMVQEYTAAIDRGSKRRKH